MTNNNIQKSDGTSLQCPKSFTIKTAFAHGNQFFPDEYEGGYLPNLPRHIQSLGISPLEYFGTGELPELLGKRRGISLSLLKIKPEVYTGATAILIVEFVQSVIYVLTDEHCIEYFKANSHDREKFLRRLLD